MSASTLAHLKAQVATLCIVEASELSDILGVGRTHVLLRGFKSKRRAKRAWRAKWASRVCSAKGRRAKATMMTMMIKSKSTSRNGRIMKDQEEEEAQAQHQDQKTARRGGTAPSQRIQNSPMPPRLLLTIEQHRTLTNTSTKECEPDASNCMKDPLRVHQARTHLNTSCCSLPSRCRCQCGGGCGSVVLV